MTRYRLLRGTIVALAALAALVLAICVSARIGGAIAFHYARERYERAIGSLDPATFERPKLPEVDNAVTWLRPGTLSIVLLGDEKALIGKLNSEAPGEWARDDIARLETILDRNAPAITLLGRARGLREANWDIPYGEGTSAKIPNLLAAIDAGKLLFARARLATARGDVETAVASVEILGSLARSLEAEPELIVQLIGTAVERLQLAEINALIASPSTTVADLARLESSLSEHDPIARIRAAFRADTAAMIHDLHSDESLRGLPRLVPRTLALGVTDLAAAAALRARVRHDPAIGGAIIQPVTHDEAYATPSGWWGDLLSGWGPNTALGAARATATASARDLARLALALRRERQSAPSYAPALPTIADVPRTDPLSGQEWGYALHPDGSAEVRSETTAAIVRGIFVTGWLSFDSLFRWTLPPDAPPRERR